MKTAAAIALLALSACGGEGPGEGDGWFGSIDPPGGGIDTTGPRGTCIYPEGPYGVEAGQPIDPTLSWQGYRPGSTELSTFTMEELFDCDGSEGIHAILMITSQHGCAPCYEEASLLELRMETWRPMGIRAAVLLVNDVYSGPPTEQSTLSWKKEFGLESVGVFLDPYFALVPGDSVYTPMQTIVDPRTMYVIERIEGLPPEFPTLEALAIHNGG